MAKRKSGCLKFEDLSKEAKERAIEKWREKSFDWDQHDTDQLSDDFKYMLKEAGFRDDVDVCWSLGYCRGDGVAFSGYINLEVLLNTKGWKSYKNLIGHASAHVKRTDSHYCHWNSMDVEVNLEITDSIDLLPKKIRDEIYDWEINSYAITREYQKLVMKVEAERERPRVEWHKARQSQKPFSGVLDWIPESSEAAPPDLDIPFPEKPRELIEPARFSRARDTAKEKLKAMELQANELEKDIADWVKDKSRELEKNGYSEIEYKGSSEYISDTIIANDYDFTEDGDMC